MSNHQVQVSPTFSMEISRLTLEMDGIGNWGDWGEGELGVRGACLAGLATQTNYFTCTV